MSCPSSPSALSRTPRPLTPPSPGGVNQAERPSRDGSTGARGLAAGLAILGVLLAASPISAAHGSAPYAGPADSVAAEDARLAGARSDIDHARLEAAEVTLRALLDEARDETRDDADANTDLAARLMLGELLLTEQRPDEALEVLMPLDEVDDYAAQSLLGQAFMARGQALAERGARREDVAFTQELALASLERAVDLAPAGEAGAAVDALQLSLYTLYDPETALELADRALERSPSAGEVLLLRGCAGGHAYWNAAADGDTERADALWTRAVEDLRAAQQQLDPQRVEPWVQLAWLELQQDDTLDQALADAREAADRGVLTSLFDVASVGAMRGDNAPAAAALFELQERDPALLTGLLAARDDAAPLAERFSHAIFQSDATYDEAREVHAALTEGARDSSALWNNYALLCRDTGVYDESYRAYTMALEISGPEPRLLNDTALVLHYHLMGEDAELAGKARTMYGQAITLAKAALACEDLDGNAKADLEEALTDASNNLRLLDAGICAER